MLTTLGIREAALRGGSTNFPGSRSSQRQLCARVLSRTDHNILSLTDPLSSTGQGRCRLRYGRIETGPEPGRYHTFNPLMAGQGRERTQIRNY